jgi:hypothetical protein
MIPTEQQKQAEQNGLVIVYGCSDDLMEFGGAMYDEFGCYNGGICEVDKEGILPDKETIEDEDDDDALIKWVERKKKSKKIHAIWCSGDYSWQYKTQIPHATFVMPDKNNDEPNYCLGLVFSINDL